MAQQPETDGRSGAELVLRLSRAALGEGFVEALTSAQWMALRYFSRANRFSRTVSAFAEFHATTRGTASQTVKGLIEQGYLARIPSETDGAQCARRPDGHCEGDPRARPLARAGGCRGSATRASPWPVGQTSRADAGPRRAAA